MIELSEVSYKSHLLINDHEAISTFVLNSNVCMVKNAQKSIGIESNNPLKKEGEQVLPDNVLELIARYVPISEQRKNYLYRYLPRPYRIFYNRAVRFMNKTASAEFFLRLINILPKEYHTKTIDVFCEYVVKNDYDIRWLIHFYESFTSTEVLSKNLIERVQSELMKALSQLTKLRDRDMGFKHIIKFTNCTPFVVNELANTLNYAFYENALINTLYVTDKLEEFESSNQDVSYIIENLKRYLKSVNPAMRHAFIQGNVFSEYGRKIFIIE